MSQAPIRRESTAELIIRVQAFIDRVKADRDRTFNREEQKQLAEAYSKRLFPHPPEPEPEPMPERLVPERLVCQNTRLPGMRGRVIVSSFDNDLVRNMFTNPNAYRNDFAVFDHSRHWPGREYGFYQPDGSMQLISPEFSRAEQKLPFHMATGAGLQALQMKSRRFGLRWSNEDKTAVEAWQHNEGRKMVDRLLYGINPELPMLYALLGYRDREAWREVRRKLVFPNTFELTPSPDNSLVPGQSYLFQFRSWGKTDVLTNLYIRNRLKTAR